MAVRTEIILGDCKQQLKNLPDNSVDLIFTSPPYSDKRKKTYGGIHPQEYVEWFLPIAAELRRVLKPTGTFLLNIKENVDNGERHTYVLELILEMRKQGWLWTEEFMWHKRNCVPGKWPNRFRDAWERLLQFNKQKQFTMYQEAVMVPVGNWAKSRLKNLSETDKVRDNSKVGSGFGKNISNWVGRDMVYPSNVLHLATECSNKNHSAAFPEELPEWFIKLFTKEGDTVLDPFAGSGTTVFVAKRMARHSIAIELLPHYHQLIVEGLKTTLLKPTKKQKSDALTTEASKRIKSKDKELRLEEVASNEEVVRTPTELIEAPKSKVNQQVSVSHDGNIVPKEGVQTQLFSLQKY